MAANPQLPRPQSALIDARDWPTSEWHTFWQQLLQFVQENGGTAEQIAEILARIEALENGGAGIVKGDQSIFTTGVLPNVVTVTLLNDSAAPGNTYYYGTGPTGTKGFFAVADSVEAESGELTKSVAPDGVSTFGLADVPDGGGGTLQKTAFDAKGRKTGTSAANTDALPEGAVNLYFTDARAIAALGNGSGDGTTGQFLRGDNNWSNTLLGPLILQSAVTPDIAMQYTGSAVSSQSIFGMNGGDTTATQATINFRANENWGVGARGTRIDFRATPNGSTTLTMAASIQNTGTGFGTTTPNYAGFGVGVTAESSSIALFEVASSRPDGNAMLMGAFSGNCRTNIATHNRIAETQINTDGTTANQRGGMLSFATKANGSTAFARRWNVRETGHFLPELDNTYNIGSAALRVKEYFGAVGAINTSDETQKMVRGPLSAAELAAASQLAREVQVFQWKDAVAEKGGDARLHIGWMAQRVRDVMAEHGLDGFRYGFLCYDEWGEQAEVWQDFEAQDEVWEWSEGIPAEVDEKTGEVIRWEVAPVRGALLREATPARRELVQAYRPAGSLYGLRKDELQAFITAAQEQRLAAIEATLNL